MLSPKEIELVNNAELILTKNSIIKKVYELFGALNTHYREIIAGYPSFAATAAFALTPKIARGEYYEGLPWVMLDYPRSFTRDDVFAVRSFFWWGHYCSITLQLAGKFQQQYTEAIGHYFQSGTEAAKEEWFIGTGADPWQHHFREDNYLPLAGQVQGIDMKSLPYIKLAKKIPLTQWGAIQPFFEKNYTTIVAMLQG